MRESGRYLFLSLYYKQIFFEKEGNHVFRSVELKESLGCGFCSFIFFDGGRTDTWREVQWRTTILDNPGTVPL